MFKSRFLRNTAATGFLVLFILLTGIRAESSTMPTDDQLLKIIPAESLFCIRVNHFEYTLSQIDQFLAGVSPMPMGISIRARSQFAKVLGSPQLNGVNMNGSFAVFGAIPPGEPTQTNPISKVFIGGLVPVTDYRQLISGNPNCSQPDEKGVSKITSNGTPIMLVTQAGNYAIISWANDYDKLVVMAKSISASKAAGLASALDAAEAKLAMTEPIWVYGNVQQASRTFGPLVLDKIEEVKTQMKSIEPNRPGAPPRNIQTLAENMINMYVSIFEKLMKETSSVSLTLRPKPTALNLKVGISAVSGTDMANMFVADASAAQENKLLGYLEDGAIVNVGFKANTPFLKKLNDKRFDLLAVIAGEDITAEDTAKLKILATDMVDSLGGLAAFSFSIDAKNKPPFAIKYVIEVKDADKFDKVIKESIEMMNTSGIMDFYKSFGLEMSFAIKQDIERYKGVSIDSAKLVMKSTDPNSPQGQMMNAMFVDGFDYRWGIVNGLWVCTVSSEPDSAIRELIDQVKAGGPTQMGDEMRKALTLLPEANQADFVATYNFLRWFKMVGAIMPMPMPMLQMDIPARSNIVFAGKAGNGKMVVDIALPKEHLMEIVAAFQMMQQQLQKEAMAKAPEQDKRALSLNNLRQIALACLLYADEHDGKFAPDLQQLYPYHRNPKILESPRKPKDFDGPSYIYIAGLNRGMQEPRKIIIAYENPAFCSDRICVAFLDGHSESMRPAEFFKRLQATYKQLGRDMPEIKFKSSRSPGLPKKFPTRSLKSTDKLDLSGTQTTDADLAERLEGLTSLRELNLNRTQITNKGLAHLRGLSSLRKLFLGNTQITDSGLKYLRNLISLQYLCFHGTQVGDAGLAHLQDLTSLQSLCLHDTQVSDDGLAHLRGLTSLRILHLRNTQVSDAGLAYVKNLAGLQNLCVHNTQVSDTGLAYLKDLASLRSLCLHDTQVGDDGLAHLRGLTSLKNLYLQNTQVSDAGLVHLKGLTSLKQLNLNGTKVSSAGLLGLKQTLSNCRISGPDAPVARRAESPLIDKPAPSFTLQDLNGKQVSLSDFKGKVVLLDFWATWCGPCRQAIPHIEALHKRYKDQGLVVIGINRERDQGKVKKFAKEQISYVVLLDADEQFKEYGISGIPTAFYIDREGKIRYRDVGFGPGKEREIEQKVKELLTDKEEIKLVTTRERQESRVPEKEEVAVLRKQKPPPPQKLNGNVLAFDDFDGKLNLKWDILHTDLSHISLTKNPGTLTITTQKGSLRGSNKNYKNLFLIDCPSRAGGDFQITTYLSFFKPVARYQQAGLICYNDEDNFLRFVYAWRPGQCSFTSTCEVDGRKTSTAISLIDEQLERIWLRVTKSGNWYTFSSSLDGKSFHDRGAYAWGDGLVKRVGILATNGLPSKAPEIDASFDFFEVKDAPVKPGETVGVSAKFIVPSKNLRIPKEMQACAANLKKIYTAIKIYEKDKGELPNWLSDLVPKYLGSEMLLCPNDTMHKSPYSPDPKLPCSYAWQFSAKPIPTGWDPTGRTIYRDWKARQVEFFGDVVPKVRCHHHGSRCLNLSVGGQIWWGPLDWEYMFKPDYRFSSEVIRPERQISSRANFTPWMNSSDYQKEFERRGRNRFYPVKVEGRTYKGENQYRTIFEPFLPRSLTFFSCHGLQEQPYVKKNKDCLLKGYKQIHLQTFEDHKGVKRYQATWIRFRDESPKRQQRVIQPAGQLRITGVVRDEAGEPLAGVKLQVFSMSRGEVTSDSQGRFEVRWDPRRLGSRETVHYLLARLEERNLAAAVEIDEETKTLDVKLEPGVVFAGKVVDPDGKGIAGARIMIMLRVSNWGSSLGRGQVADVEGKFEVRALPLEHKYSLAARAEGYGEKRIEVHTNDAVDNHLDVGRLTLAVADLSVSGLVVDADDKPVANARVYCYGEGQQTRIAQTDTNGKFTLEKICKGRIQITASVSGKRRLSGYTQTEGGATDVKIVIGERPSATRYIPKQPPSLRGKPLPNMKDFEIEPSPADTNTKDEEGLTAIHLAARQGRKDVVEQLLANGANINARLTGWPGWMPLHEAAAANHKEVAELLLDKGADANADCARAGGGRFGGTPLHEAVFEGHRDMTELLISGGADINAKQSGGLTPLDVAAFVGHKEVVELLIARGADVNIRDRGGRTALRWAKHGRHKEIVELLQKHGAVE